MRTIAFGVGIVLALAAHVLLGWMWSVVGALVAGFVAPNRAAWVGAITMVASWGLLIAWNLAVASTESFNMMETMGDLLGGMPGVVIPLVTLIIAGLLGLLGGALGGALKPVKKQKTSS